MSTRQRVVIVGAGFAGLSAARALAAEDVDVVIVDRHNFHTFVPLLYQVATAGLNAADVAHPVRGIFQDQPNVDFRKATVSRVDWDQRRLLLEDGDSLGFDHLIVAAGSTSNTFGIPGVAEHGFNLYALAGAVRLRNHVLGRFEAAAANPALVDDGALNVVVVGGGATGVEVAGAMSELYGMVLRKDFPSLDMRRARIVLVEMGDTLLPAFGPNATGHARETLEAHGVEIRLGCTVERVSATRVSLSGQETIPAHTLVWAAGIKANPLAEALGVPLGKAGRVPVHCDLSIPGHRDAYVIGDLAHIVGRDGEPVPQLAPAALQTGRHAARQIVRRRAGYPTRPFRYRDKGTMATIGRRAAVAELPLGISLWGTPAWLAWLGLHLVFLIGFRNRLSVFVNWAWNYMTYDRGPRLIFDSTEPDP